MDVHRGDVSKQARTTILRPIEQYSCCCFFVFFSSCRVVVVVVVFSPVVVVVLLSVVDVLTLTGGHNKLQSVVTAQAPLTLEELEEELIKKQNKTIPRYETTDKKLKHFVRLMHVYTHHCFSCRNPQRCEFLNGVALFVAHVACI